MKPANVKTSIIISTPEQRVSYLFTKALEFAEDGNVLFISKVPINELPKGLSYTGQIDKDILRRITFAYPTNWNEIISQCSIIHTWRTVPFVIIVDSLTDYLTSDPTPTPTKSSFLCAALLDAAGVCAKVNKNICNLIVSVDKDVFNADKTALSILFDNYFYDNVIEM